MAAKKAKRSAKKKKVTKKKATKRARNTVQVDRLWKQEAESALRSLRLMRRAGSVKAGGEVPLEPSMLMNVLARRAQELFLLSRKVSDNSTPLLTFSVASEGGIGLVVIVPETTDDRRERMIDALTTERIRQHEEGAGKDYPEGLTDEVGGAGPAEDEPGDGAEEL